MAALSLISVVLLFVCIQVTVYGSPISKPRDEGRDIGKRLFALLTNMYIREYHTSKGEAYKRYVNRVYTFIKRIENENNQKYDLRSQSSCVGDDCDDVADSRGNELLSSVINTKDGAKSATKPDEKKKEDELKHDLHKVKTKTTDDSGKRNFNPTSTLWTAHTVPYVFKDMTNAQKELVDKAIKIFHKETCISFKPKESRDKNYVVFDGKTSGYCQSSVGMVGGEQIINLPSPGCSDVQTAIHEIMHLLGQEHEQSRSDRSRYLNILWGNLSPGMGPDFAREKIRKLENDHYDVYSTLQYMLDSGAKDSNKPTMVLKNSKLNYLAALSKTLSHTDKLEINSVYKCIDKCRMMSCQNTGFPVWTHDNKKCHCKCPPKFKGEQCEIAENPCRQEGDVILELNKETTIKAPHDQNGKYAKGKHCRIFVKGPQGSRIKATVTKLGLAFEDYGSLKECVHFVQFSFDMISQPGKIECGEVPNAESKTLTFLKTESSESNLMLITFNSMKHSPEEAVTYDGPGFVVKLIAYKSGCIPNRCRLPATCEDSEDTKSFVCKCSSGYSGDLCDYVRLTDTVRCNVDGDLNGDCFVRNDKNIPDARFKEVVTGKGKPDANGKPTVMKAPNGVGLFATIDAEYFGKTARLITDLKFEVGERCLSFQYYIAIHKYNGEDEEPSNYRNIIRVWYSGTNVKQTKLFERDDSENDEWEMAKIQIPGVENLKIEIEAKYGSGDIGNGIDNIVLQKTCSGPCYPSPCKNSGRCYQSGSSLKCRCRRGFVGKFCETDLCNPNPCKNGGTCNLDKNNPSKYKCKCQDGFKGDNCDIKICAKDTCKNGGTCRVVGEDFECNCDIKYTGKTCEETVCKPDSCMNKGKCVVIDYGTVECECAAGFTGNKCEKEVCKPNPCQNGGICTAPGDYYECKCPSGYYGEKCENDVCNPDPCKNGATCKRDNGEYPNCVCTDLFYGDYCDKKTSLCGGPDKSYKDEKWCKDGTYCDSDEDCKHS